MRNLPRVAQNGMSYPQQNVDDSPTHLTSLLGIQAPGSPSSVYDENPSPARSRNQDSFSSGTGMLGMVALPGRFAIACPSYESVAGILPANRYNAELGYHYPPSRVGASVADMGHINPMDLADDDDDEFDFGATPSGQGHYVPGSIKSHLPATIPSSVTSRTGNGRYAKLSGVPVGGDEKSDWLDQQTTANKRLKWLVGSAVVTIIVLAIVGGAIGAVLARNPAIKTVSPASASTGSTPPSNGNAATSTGLTKDSAEIKALMNNANLHKVFPGIDYTPINTQYPACLTTLPSQDNVTKDIAVLSQLTPQVRLYGTDCKQTEMVLHAINTLGLNESMKVWLGVWQENNATTNARQLAQMWDVLSSYGTSPFAGIIVGNEVLFRQDMSVSSLIDVLQTVRTNLTSMNLALPLATSDLGSEWTVALAGAVDIVM